ncbi:DUF2793 domain-containing protein [Hyphococcus sp.]|uniref:DUF2793 domain-containing protein n=1 Tax=Hyphococcus sp. TaxID=2038636 RepID=UPI002086F0E3|nr:MAG: hypothetical protein DHS20C04_13490 [Marinicaulis sp.]
MEQSPRLSLSYVMPSQAQKHVTVNESFRRLDALTQMSVLSRSETAEPGAPSEGEAYILPSGASGDVWDGYDEHDIAVYHDGAWARITPGEGFRAWVSDDDEFVVFDGSDWVALSSGGASETAAKFGINTGADATNKLAVKSDAVLFNHDDVTPGSGDCQVKINKDAAGDTGSLLFQTGASGRAEFGLAGDDDFHVKVSADGSSWNEAIRVKKDTGFLGVAGRDNTGTFALDVGGGFRFWASDPATNQNCYIIDQDTGGVTNIFWYKQDETTFYLGTSAGHVIMRGATLQPGGDNNQSLGTSSNRWSVVYSATGTINTSDEREKLDLRDSDLGLAFLEDIRPVKFRYLRGGSRQVRIDPETDKAEYEATPGQRTHYGLSPQNVRAALDKHGVEDFAGWVLTDKNDPASTQGLRYDQFTSILINAVQELSREVKALKARV